MRVISPIRMKRKARLRAMEGLPRMAGLMPIEGGECNAVSASSVVVKRGRIVCEVMVSNGLLRYSNPEVARRLLERYPSLSHHACVNAEGRTFGCVMDHTSIAHLLEHLVIELQTQASSNPSAVFVGTSEWVDESAGIARVEVSFFDDLQALHALKEALDIINSLV